LRCFKAFRSSVVSLTIARRCCPNCVAFDIAIGRTSNAWVWPHRPAKRDALAFRCHPPITRPSKARTTPTAQGAATITRRRVSPHAACSRDGNANNAAPIKPTDQVSIRSSCCSDASSRRRVFKMEFANERAFRRRCRSRSASLSSPFPLSGGVTVPTHPADDGASPAPPPSAASASSQGRRPRR
jgi:hypothetical protein